MTPAPQRRWSYSLRTLFVVVTAFGCWLASELNWIRERHALLAEFPQGEFFPSTRSVTAPGMLWLFGEQGHAILMLTVEGNRSEQRSMKAVIVRVKSLFPEALVTTEDDNPFK